MVKDIKSKGRKPKNINMSEIMALKDDGYTIDEIAEVIGVHRATVLRRLRDFENQPSELEQLSQIITDAKESTPARFSIPKDWNLKYLSEKINHLTVGEVDILWRLLTSSKTKGHEFVFEFLKQKLTLEMNPLYPKDLIQRYWIDLESSLSIFHYLFFKGKNNRTLDGLFDEFLHHRPIFNQPLHPTLEWSRDKFSRAMEYAKQEYYVSPERKGFSESVENFKKDIRKIKPRIIDAINEYQYEINLKESVNEELNQGLEELKEFFNKNINQHHNLLEKLIKNEKLPRVNSEEYQLWGTILKIFRNTKPTKE